MNELFQNHGLGTAYGVPALAGVVLTLKGVGTISARKAKLSRYRLKPGLHTLCLSFGCEIHTFSR